MSLVRYGPVAGLDGCGEGVLTGAAAPVFVNVTSKVVDAATATAAGADAVTPRVGVRRHRAI